MIQVLPKVFTSLGFYDFSPQVSGVNDGGSALVFGFGRAPMALPGTVRNLTLYDGEGFRTTVDVAVAKNGTPTSLATSLAAGAAARQAADTTHSVDFVAGDYIDYDFTSALGPAMTCATSLNLEADEMLFGICAPYFTNFAAGTGFTAAALGNGFWTTYSGDPTAPIGSICPMPCTLDHLCLRRYSAESGGSYDAWIILNGVIQDGTGGTVDTYTTLDDASMDPFIVGTFDLPLVPLDRVLVLIFRVGTDAAYPALFGAGTAVTPTTANHYMFCGGSNDHIPNTGTSWKWTRSLEGSINIGAHTAPVGETPFVVTGMYIDRLVAPLGSVDHTLLRSGSPTAITVPITGSSDHVGSIVGEYESFSAGETITIQIDNGVDGTQGSELHWGIAVATPGGTGTIVVGKRAEADPDAEFVITGGGGLDDTPITLSHAETSTYLDVPAGTGYTLEETLPDGWTQVDVTVSNDPDNDPLNITVGEGEAVYVTFFNALAGDVGSNIHNRIVCLHGSSVTTIRLTGGARRALTCASGSAVTSIRLTGSA